MMSLFKIVKTQYIWVMGTQKEWEDGVLDDGWERYGDDYERVLTAWDDDDLKDEIAGDDYIQTIPYEVRTPIERRVENKLRALGFKDNCLERLVVKEALNSRLCDIEEVIK